MNIRHVIAALLIPASAVAVNSPRIPFSFVENKGQSEKEIRYIGNGAEFKAWFRDNGVVYERPGARMGMVFVGGREHPAIEGSGPLGARANFIHGADPGDWQTDIPMFGVLSYRGVWPGIDVRFRAGDSHPKAEYVLAPGASIDSIRLRFDGKATVLRNGSLAVSGDSGELHEEPPVLFQDGPAGRRDVKGAYRIYSDGTVGFSAGTYDSREPLVIDPPIVFSGYFGGSSEITITAVAVNSYFNTIVAGWTEGSNLPATGGARPNSGGGVDAFVAGFDPAGGTLLFCTYIGGSGDDRAFGVAVDSSNNTYVTGWTSSANFPVAGGVQAKLGGTRNAFVTKLNPAGNALIFSTYLGGSGVDAGNAITLDSTNAPVIVGDTTSANLATTAGVVQPKLAGNQDVFVAKLSPTGGAITFLTYFGGSAADHGAALALNSTGYVFIAGSTSSPNFPVLSAFQPRSGGGQDGFVAKLSPNANAILFSTYYGGSGGTASAPEEINALVLGPSGNPIVAGTTSSTNFPVTPSPIQATFAGGNTDGFIGRLSGTTGALQESTYLGGSSNDGINAVAVDFFGHVYVAGYTTSWDFPTTNPLQNGPAGGMDAFVAKITWGGLMFSSYLGGTGNDSALAMALDSMTSITIVGQTGSPNYPVAGQLESWQGNTLSAFITKLAPNFIPVLFSAPNFLIDIWHDTGYNGPNITLNVAPFGQPGDIPIIGDWDGSGVKRIGVFRSGNWLLDINGDGVFDAGDKTVAFGQAGDLPVVGDWNGTGVIKLGLYRQGSFILDLSGHLSGVATGLGDVTFPFGLSTDLPVAMDWNQSGTTKVGVFRNGYWLVDYNGDHVFNGLDKTYLFGQTGDLPVIGDWSSSGTPKIGVYRNGLWILDYGGYNAIFSGSELNIAFGGIGYIPLVM